jgi:hypothetical protein
MPGLQRAPSGQHAGFRAGFRKKAAGLLQTRRQPVLKDQAGRSSGLGIGVPDCIRMGKEHTHREVPSQNLQLKPFVSRHAGDVLSWRKMLRIIALLVAFCTAGVPILDARCVASCSAKKFRAPLTSKGCHHHKPDSSQSPGQSCLHGHGMDYDWLLKVSTAVATVQVGPPVIPWHSERVPDGLCETTARRPLTLRSPQTQPPLPIRV